MTRVNVLLFIAVMASALYLVRTQYQSRRLYTELDRAVTTARWLDTENERLQVEKRSQATPLRVEKLARAKLQMRTTTPAVTQYVADPLPRVHIANANATDAKATMLSAPALPPRPFTAPERQQP
jgi:cell division protein FtsL